MHFRTQLEIATPETISLIRKPTMAKPPKVNIALSFPTEEHKWFLIQLMMAVTERTFDTIPIKWKGNPIMVSM